MDRMSKPRTDCKIDSSCSRANLLRLREVAGLSLTEATHPPDLQVPPHSHEEAHFCLLLQGHYEENCGKHIVVRKPSTLAVMASGAIHSNRIHSAGIRSCLCGTGSVKVLLKSIESAQSMCAASLFRPFPFIRLTASMRAPVPTSTFFGSHPRSWQVPPNGRESLIATDQPALRHLKAAADAAAPVPITMRSNFRNYSPHLFLL